MTSLIVVNVFLAVLEFGNIFREADGTSVVHLCAKAGPPEILQELVRIHPDSPRYEAANENLVKFLTFLYNSSILSWKYRDDQTPLHNVVWDSVGERLLKKAKILLCNSDDWARLQGMLDGRTPMHWARNGIH